MAAETPKCLLCGQEAIPSVVILDQVICHSCEEMLVTTSCQDEAYDDLVAGLCPLAKQILSRAS